MKKILLLSVLALAIASCGTNRYAQSSQSAPSSTAGTKVVPVGDDVYATSENTQTTDPAANQQYAQQPAQQQVQYNPQQSQSSSQPFVQAQVQYSAGQQMYTPNPNGYLEPTYPSGYNAPVQSGGWRGSQYLSEALYHNSPEYIAWKNQQEYQNSLYQQQLYNQQYANTTNGPRHKVANSNPVQSSGRQVAPAQRNQQSARFQRSAPQQRSLPSPQRAPGLRRK